MNSGSERQWLLPVCIVAGVVCLFLIGSKLGSPANAQEQLQAGTANEVLVVPVQIDRDSYGIAMVDTVGQTMWIYELTSRGPVHGRMKLLAARSWKYDRLLEEYNTAEPKPEQIKMLLEELKQVTKQTRKTQQEADVNILSIAEPKSDEKK